MEDCPNGRNRRGLPIAVEREHHGRSPKWAEPRPFQRSSGRAANVCIEKTRNFALLGGATWKIRRAKPAVRALRLHTLPPV